MPRYSGWGGGWPFMYMHQPGGWGEQTWGMGFGNRNNSNNNNNHNNNGNNPFSQCGDLNSLNGHNPNTLNVDNLSGLFARLILQNHLTRLADMGCHGGALYGCSLPSTSSPSSSSQAPHNHNSSSSSSSSSPHNHHNCQGGGGIAPNNNDINNSSRCQVCVHTCPNATQPYMATNNVFVIPAAHVQQQQQQPQHQHQPPQVPGLTGVNLNNITMFLNSLGLALGGGASNNISGCGGNGNGNGGGMNPPANFSVLPVFGPGTCGGAQVSTSPNNGGFSCAACCNHIRM